MTGQWASGPMTDVVGFCVLAITGLAGTLWMGRLYRVAEARCLRLADDIVRAQEARGRLKDFLSDLIATLNLSLACYAGISGGERRERIEQLSGALHQAVEAQGPLTSSSVQGEGGDVCRFR